MERIIIWGIGDWGAQAYYCYRDQADILFFVDSNEDYWNTELPFLENMKVFSPEKIHDYPDVKVILAVKDCEEIRHKLDRLGNKYICHVDEYQKAQQNLLKEMYEEKSIDLGALLLKAGELTVTQSFIWGSSGTLDYLLLCAIAKYFGCQKYLEIGTFIGDSICSVSNICKECHSVTAAPGEEFSMTDFCRKNNIPDYSERLAQAENIIHHYGDSKLFDFSEIGSDIDLFFVDGDHRCNGVYLDAKHIFDSKKEDAFVVWHDFKSSDYKNGGTMYSAIRMAVGEENFKNIFTVDSNICAIYIPPKYQSEFNFRKLEWTEKKQDMYYYDIKVNARIDRV